MKFEKLSELEHRFEKFWSYENFLGENAYFFDIHLKKSSYILTTWSNLNTDSLDLITGCVTWNLIETTWKIGGPLWKLAEITSKLEEMTLRERWNEKEIVRIGWKLLERPEYGSGGLQPATWEKKNQLLVDK